MAKTQIPYNFPNETVKENFRTEAFNKRTSIVAMITDALKKQYPKLFKTQK